MKTLSRKFARSFFRRMRKGAAVAVLIIASASSPIAHAESDRAEVAPMTYEQLEQLISSGQIKSVEDLLGALPEDLRSHYALLFRSRSLQGATFADPRLILYGNDAKLVLSFNGDATQRGYDALEVMAFDETTTTFQFREIAFDIPHTAGTAPSLPKISAANPEKCQRCHGNPTRPVWDSFPVWAGAYGERYRKPFGAAEEAGLAAFLKLQPTNSRYRFLLNTDRLNSSDLFVTDVRGRLNYNGVSKMPPNAELGTLLSTMNFRMLAKEVAASPRFAPYAPALVRSLDIDCGDLDRAIPSELWYSFGATYGAFRDQVLEANQHQAHLKQARTTSKESGDNESVATPEATIRFLYLAKMALGLPVESWITALEKGTYDFRTIDLGLGEVEPLLVAAASPAVRSAQPVKQAADRYCAKMEQMSLDSLADAAAHKSQALALMPEAAVTPSGLVQLCSGCHERGAGPALTFSRPAELAASFKNTGYERGSLLDEILYRISDEAGADEMPRGKNLSIAERDLLRRYFLSLTSK